MRADLIPIFAAAAAFAGTSTASAHPHVFVDPRPDAAAKGPPCERQA